MSGIYESLMARAREAYQRAGNSFHPEPAAQGIAAALDGFDQPLQQIGAAIAGAKSDGLPGASTAMRDGLRLLDAQLTVLQPAIDSAARADQNKVARAALLDQARLAQAAKIQQAADGQLFDAVTRLIGTVRQDAAAASGSGAGDGAGVDDLKPVNVEALEESLHARESPQDKWASAELEQIGGQRIEGDGGVLTPINVEALSESVSARASPQDRWASDELTQISGQTSEWSA